MLNLFSKVLLVLTSLAPVLFTYSFVAWLEGRFIPLGVILLIVALALALIALGVLREARRQLEVFEIGVNYVKTVDREVIGFLVAYLLPLASRAPLPILDWRVATFVLLMFFAVVWGTHSYHFNPLLGILGYHFFEIRTTDNVTYVLVTKRDLRDTAKRTRAVMVSEYMLLDVTGGAASESIRPG